MTATAKSPAKPAAKAKDGKVKKSKKKNLRIGSIKYKSPHVSLKRLFKLKPKVKHPKKDGKKKPRKPMYVVKPFGAEGKENRTVYLGKRTAQYPTANRVHKAPSKALFKNHKRHTRASLTPGTVCILLAGKHQGKRVVLLKTLASGLLLVTGPFKLNACPLRRVHQNYVIGTSTKIDISKVEIPETINDKYFQRVHKKKAKKEEGEIFAKKVERYTPSEQRKKDQVALDKQMIAAIKLHPDKKLLFSYLKSFFALRSGQFPHHMKF